MSIAQAVMQTYYPLFCKEIFTAVDYLNICPVTDTPANPIYMLVRDPIDRFLSAVAVLNMDVDIAIAGLGNGLELNEHFIPQASYQVTKSFQYPAQIADFCTAIGVASLPTVNETLSPKSSLTIDQANALQAFYAADIALYNNLGAQV